MRSFLFLVCFLAVMFTAIAPSIACPTEEDLAISIAKPQAELRDCREHAVFQLDLSHRAVNVAVAGHSLADKKIIPTIQNSLEASAQSLRGMGPYSPASITVFLVSTEAAEIGVASSDNVATAIVSADEPSSCLILVWSPVAEINLLKFAIAHEFFHCVQYHEFERQIANAEQDNGREDPAWWMEGTAEWFATMTYPQYDYSREYVEDFHAKFTGSTNSIINMSYENVVFFRWMTRTFGSPRIFQFVTQYYGDKNEALHGSFNGALTHDEFNQFRDQVKKHLLQGVKP